MGDLGRRAAAVAAAAELCLRCPGPNRTVPNQRERSCLDTQFPQFGCSFPSPSGTAPTTRKANRAGRVPILHARPAPHWRCRCGNLEDVNNEAGVYSLSTPESRLRCCSPVRVAWRGVAWRSTHTGRSVEWKEALPFYGGRHPIGSVPSFAERCRALPSGGEGCRAVPSERAKLSSVEGEAGLCCCLLVWR